VTAFVVDAARAATAGAAFVFFFATTIELPLCWKRIIARSF
jgi:hypothetical protein